MKKRKNRDYDPNENSDAEGEPRPSPRVASSRMYSESESLSFSKSEKTSPQLSTIKKEVLSSENHSSTVENVAEIPEISIDPVMPNVESSQTESAIEENKSSHEETKSERNKRKKRMPKESRANSSYNQNGNNYYRKRDQGRTNYTSHTEPSKKWETAEPPAKKELNPWIMQELEEIENQKTKLREKIARHEATQKAFIKKGIPKFNDLKEVSKALDDAREKLRLLDEKTRELQNS